MIDPEYVPRVEYRNLSDSFGLGWFFLTNGMMTGNMISSQIIVIIDFIISFWVSIILFSLYFAFYSYIQRFFRACVSRLFIQKLYCKFGVVWYTICVSNLAHMQSDSNWKCCVAFSSPKYRFYGNYALIFWSIICMRWNSLSFIVRFFILTFSSKCPCVVQVVFLNVS